MHYRIDRWKHHMSMFPIPSRREQSYVYRYPASDSVLPAKPYRPARKPCTDFTHALELDRVHVARAYHIGAPTIASDIRTSAHLAIERQMAYRGIGTKDCCLAHLMRRPLWHLSSTGSLSSNRAKQSKRLTSWQVRLTPLRIA